MWNSSRFGSPFYTTEAIVLQYLFYLSRLPRSYSVVNLHKAMLLQTLPFFGNKWCKDSCNLIQRFMKGIFFENPPRPRYKMTWDVTNVLQYLSTLFPLEQLSLKLLTFKTVALIALATAPRAQTLVSLNLNHMIVNKDTVIFALPDILKTSKVGRSFSLQVEHFHRENLCALHTLLRYIKVTKSLRLSEKVFVSYVTYKPVTTSTIARWLRLVLHSSGIDTDMFKAHSYRGASASAAFSKGCSLKCILDTADWASDKKFKKFYWRQSVSDPQLSFGAAVFK